MRAELTAKPITEPSRGALAMALVPDDAAVAGDVLDAHLRLEDRRQRVGHETAERVARPAGGRGHDELDRRLRAPLRKTAQGATPAATSAATTAASSMGKRKHGRGLSRATRRF